MQLDTEFLRRHYASMPDDELLALDRADLVEAAQRIFDEEVRSRERSPSPGPSTPPPSPDEEIDCGDWLEDAAEAYTAYARSAAAPPPEAVDALAILQAAGIPCQLELSGDAGEQEPRQYQWRVLVPGKLIYRAAGVLERDHGNAEFESGWRTLLESLSDLDLGAMEPHYAFCGLYDRIERINRVYDEELKRRRLA
jgi:hypothetical protein